LKLVVIGSGIAGIVAALRAASLKREVLLVSQGKSATSRSLGVVDVLGYLNGEEVKSPEEGIKTLAETKEEHPYSLLGFKKVAESLNFFKSMAEKAGIPFKGSIEKNIHVATQFGTVKPTCLALDEVYNARVEEWHTRAVAIAGKEERNFNPGFVAASLAELLPKLGIAQPARISGSEHGDLVIKPLEQIAPGEKAYALPILGDGSFIAQRLLEHAVKLGVKVVEDRIDRARVEGGEVKEVMGKESYKGDAFILATGDWVGGGLSGLKEKVFGLELLRVEGKLVRKTPFPEKGHPYSRVGVKVDESLSPFYRGEKISNLKVAGALLGGYDYCTEKSGWGVAIASAYVAGGME
jgi:glycerol-3-phosphate dehydrogenase subunit B